MWSYLLSAVGITGLLVAAHHPRVGWMINIGAQALWVFFAVATDQHGFILASAAYTVAYVRLLRRSRRPAVVQLIPTVDAGRYRAPVTRTLPATITAALLCVALTACGGGDDTATPAAAPTMAASSPPTPLPQTTSAAPTPAAPPSPTPTPAWTPCDLERDSYEGGCETDFIYDSCDASLYSSEMGDLLDAYIENKSSVDAKRLQDCPQFLPTWKKAQNGFSDGSYEVGSEVKPGTYETTAHRTDGKVMDCYWERTGSNGKILANDFVTAAKKVRVTIRSSDEMFTSRECGNWVKV